MSTIQNTVSEATAGRVPSSHQHVVDSVVTALQEREDSIIDAIKAFASGKGLSSVDIEDALVEVGLVEPTPSETASFPEGGDLAGTVAALTETVQRLESMVNTALSDARRRGPRI